MDRCIAALAVVALAGTAMGQSVQSVNQDLTMGDGTRWITRNTGSPEGFKVIYNAVSGGAQSLDHIYTRIGTRSADPTFNGAIRATGSQVTRMDSPEGIGLRTLGDERIPGLNAQTEFFFFNNRSTVRIITSVTNISSAPITANVGLSFNPVSNNNFSYLGTSSGDLTLDEDDRWFAIDDFNPTGSVPSSLTVLGETGARVGLSDLRDRQRYSGTDLNGYEATFEAWTIQPGHTAAYMTFIDFNLLGADTVSAVSDFTDLTTLGNAGLLAQYDEEIQGELVNWVPAGPTVLPLAAFGVMAMRRRR